MATPGEFDVRTATLPDGGIVVSVSGELDLATARHLEDALASRPPDARVVIDLTGCTFLDSSGVRVLASTAGAVSSDGARLGLVVVDAGIARVLEITGIDSLIDVHSSLEGAL